MTEPMFSHSTPNDTYEGDTQLEMYRQMVERGGLSGQDIGDIFGVTRSSVSAIFKRLSPKEKAKMREQKPYWARIKKAAEGDEPLEEIAKRFDGPARRTIRHLQRFRVVKKRPNIERRQRYLIKSLFNVDMNPGPKFREYIENKIPLIDHDGYQAELLDYYVKGEDCPDRFKRSIARRKLAGILHRECPNIEAMIDEGILEVRDGS